MLRRLCCSTILLLACGAHDAWAWGATGHRVVAAIAWLDLSPTDRSKAVALLMSATPSSGIAALRPATGTEADRDAWLFIDAATWPDQVRSGPRASEYSHPNWHFDDHYWMESNGHAASDPAIPESAVNAVERLGFLDRAVENSATAPGDRGVDLAWILHLVGDVHQPLHNSSRVTPEFPKGDRGGNDVHFNSSVELHSYWDNILDEVYEDDASIPGTKTAKRAEIPTAAYVQHWASSIAAKYPESTVPKTATVDAFAQWSHDGFQLAEEHAYVGLPMTGLPDASYMHDVDDVSERQIALAGHRLALLLHTVLR